jgi:hypothetical protein
MFNELNKYKHHGHFSFRQGEVLTRVCNAPKQPGVYYFVQLKKGEKELVYIGASGTINQKGQFGKQLLKGRLTNKQDGKKRQPYFEEVMHLNKIDALHVYWFVTFDENHNDLPSFVEATLLQTYFDMHGHLPAWNKKF